MLNSFTIEQLGDQIKALTRVKDLMLTGKNDKNRRRTVTKQIEKVNNRIQLLKENKDILPEICNEGDTMQAKSCVMSNPQSRLCLRDSSEKAVGMWDR